MLAWLSRGVVLAAAVLSARARARNFVAEYMRELVRARLRTGVLVTAAQLLLLAVTARLVHRFGDPLVGRLFGSTVVWVLLVFNATRFLAETLPELAEARRHLKGPFGHVLRGMLGISIVKELVEMELLVLAVCLVVGLYARVGASSPFHLFLPWKELLASRW